MVRGTAARNALVAERDALYAYIYVAFWTGLNASKGACSRPGITLTIQTFLIVMQ